MIKDQFTFFKEVKKTILDILQTLECCKAKLSIMFHFECKN